MNFLYATAIITAILVAILIFVWVLHKLVDKLEQRKERKREKDWWNAGGSRVINTHELERKRHEPWEC